MFNKFRNDLTDKVRHYKSDWRTYLEKISVYLCKKILFYINRYLPYLCVSACTLLLICAIYIFLHQFFIIVLAIGMIVISSLGLVIADRRYIVYENKIQNELLHNMRLQLSAGIPELNEPEVEEKETNQIEVSAIVFKLEVILALFKISANFIGEKDSDKHTLYYYMLINNEQNFPDDFIPTLKKILRLKSPPRIEVNGNILLIAIAK